MNAHLRAVIPDFDSYDFSISDNEDGTYSLWYKNGGVFGSDLTKEQAEFLKEWIARNLNSLCQYHCNNSE